MPQHGLGLIIYFFPSFFFSDTTPDRYSVLSQPNATVLNPSIPLSFPTTTTSPTPISYTLKASSSRYRLHSFLDLSTSTHIRMSTDIDPGARRKVNGMFVLLNRR